MKNNTLKVVEPASTNLEFKENTDYFRMSDGIFWTIDALCKKHNTASNTIYKKARDYNIATMKVLGVTCFKDDVRFDKQKSGAGNIENLKGHQLPTYAELARSIEELIKTVRASTIPERVEANTNDCFLKLDDLYEEIKEIKTTLNKVLDYLTQPEIIEIFQEEKKDAN